MRTWGRVPLNDQVAFGGAIGLFTIGFSAIGQGGTQDYRWVEVETDGHGYNDAVWLTTLAQVLKLGLNESPMFGNYGIPAQQSVVTQVFPDYYVIQTQQLFASYFLALLVTRMSDEVNPTYAVNVTATPGATLLSPVPT